MKRSFVAAIGIIAVALIVCKPWRKAAPTTRPTRPVAAPVTTAPSTRTATTLPETRPLQTYMDVLERRFPLFPATRPFPVPVDLPDAAHLVLHDPIYLGPLGDLWLTAADADPLQTVLARAGKETEHIVPVRIYYARWMVSHSGRATVAVVCAADHGFQLVSATQRWRLPEHTYFWDRALSWDDGQASRIVVPTQNGVSVLTVDGPNIHDDFHPLITGATSQPVSEPPPCILFDLRGIITWLPSDSTTRPAHPARFVEGHWIDLAAAEFGDHIIQIIPTLDGGALAINRAEGDGVDFHLAALDTPTLDVVDVNKQIELMNDPDPQTREAAYDRLTQYGPGIFPLMQKKLDAGTPPEVEARLKALLAGKITPRLSGMQIHDNRLVVTTRLRDGGVIFSAPAGVSYISATGQQTDLDSAWLVVRPGKAVHLAAQILNDAIQHGSQIDVAGDDEWVAWDANGIFRLRPPGQPEAITRKAEKLFTHAVGIDARGRWLLRQPGDDGATLVLDPTVPDPKPRLVSWTINVDSNIGWDNDNWPAEDRGGLWLLKQAGWVAVAPDNPDKLIADLPADNSQTQPADKPLLSDPDGTQYFGGITEIVVAPAHGRRTIYTLPPQAQGSADVKPWLVHTKDGRFFLLNADNRLIRLKSQPDAAEPFKLEAVFTTTVLEAQRITRMWLDPAGRIIVAYDRQHLVVFFPGGQVPPELNDQILPGDLHSSDDE